VSKKLELAEAPARSLALTTIFKVPTFTLVGVPLKVLVFGLNLSQLGKGFPLLSVALKVSQSASSLAAASSSKKVLAGTT